jgi:hypothetical protein
MIVIIDGADLFPEATGTMIETVKPFADLLFTTNVVRKKRQNLRNIMHE